MAATDAALWEAIQHDDAGAFEALYQRYWQRMFAAAYARLAAREACEEIVHDIFLRLWTERHRLQIDCFPAYLAAAARYHVARHQRQAAARPLHYTDAPETASPARADYNQGETRLLDLDLEKRLAAALGQLPRRCQQIFLLSRVQQFSNDEIAQQLHISRRSVENQLTAALRHLRVLFKAFLLLLAIW
ncbi:RNA polymerase sigma factor [Hymenobacter actinosclerus]|uniref:RNA polymerase sigma-70 factor, ECF subfamily n=1 Tax=Hymenobacter actinosclerus TaxID=82805 RepID=A0A1I0FP75_9BACT|nr:sigma-70 family RNA polymerase sigma factor [Hymenobacter actinosclerus]SET59114.1 RNA polymerase sigma-70 factor, ECF subfamily [Hymenobacter actinosclerus]